METCDYDVKIPTEGPFATGPSCGRPALRDMRAQYLSPLVHIFAARFPPRMGYGDI